MSVFCKHGWAGSNCKECNIEMLEAQLANAEQEIDRLRGALKHQGGPLCMARYHPTAECTCGVSETLAGKAGK
jgi:hypothetical protein